MAPKGINSMAFHIFHCFCDLQGLTSNHKAMPLALCQIIAHEVTLENIRRKNKVCIRRHPLLRRLLQ